MRRTRSALLAASILGTVLVAPQAAGADGGTAGCPFERLPLPHRASASSVRAADPSGRWLTGAMTYGGRTRGVVWHHDRPTELDLAYEYVLPTGITRHGTVAGEIANGGDQVGFVYADGAVRLLPIPEGFYFVTVTGIDRRGRVGGWAMTVDGERAAAYVWAPEDAYTPTRLRTPDGFAITVGPSADGHIAVNLLADDGGFRSFVFDRRLRRTEMHGTRSGYDAGVSAIADGWLSGYEEPSKDRAAANGRVSHALRWRVGESQAEILPAATYQVDSIGTDGTVGGLFFDGDSLTGALYGDSLVRLQKGNPHDMPVVNVVRPDSTALGGAEVSHRSGHVVPVRWDCR
jgi:hypothetical protein